MKRAARDTESYDISKIAIIEYHKVKLAIIYIFYFKTIVCCLLKTSTQQTAMIALTKILTFYVCYITRDISMIKRDQH